MLLKGLFYSLLLLLLPLRAGAVISAGDPVGPKVLACYNELARGKPTTIQKVYDCSGVWVTPRALLLCALEVSCPALPDTIEGRTTLDANLTAENLNRDSNLTLRPSDLPPMPDAATIARCKKESTTEADFEKCLTPTIAPAKYGILRDCFGKATDAERVACFTKQVNDQKLTALVGCLGAGHPSAEQLLECNPSGNLTAQNDKLRQCILTAASVEVSRSCITASLPQSPKPVTQCLSAASTNAQIMTCFDQTAPTVAGIRTVVGCLNIGDASPLSCGAGIAGKTAGPTLDCLVAANDASARLTCAAAANPELSRTGFIVGCADKQLKGDRLTACLSPYLVPRHSDFDSLAVFG
jgi:hypothetical protein